MKFGSCRYADEVAAVLLRGHWPDACDAELRAHVDGCSRCGEQVLVSQSFQQSRMEAVKEARIGSAGLLWWRAQFRQRNAALEQVSRPMTLAQIFAVVVSVSAVAGLVVSHLSKGMDWLSWFSDPERPMPLSELFQLVASMEADGSLMLLASGLVAVALIRGVVYLASDER